MMESWAAAVLFRPVNYFHRKLGVFSIIAKDFRRDVAPVSVPATMAVNNNSYNSYNNSYNKYNKSLVSSLLSYFKFQTWVTDSVATCCKIFLPFFLMIHFSQLDFYLLCACVCRLVWVYWCQWLGVAWQNELPVAGLLCKIWQLSETDQNSSRKEQTRGSRMEGLENEWLKDVRPGAGCCHGN